MGGVATWDACLPFLLLPPPGPQAKGPAKLIAESQRNRTEERLNPGENSPHEVSRGSTHCIEKEPKKPGLTRISVSALTSPPMGINDQENTTL